MKTSALSWMWAPALAAILASAGAAAGQAPPLPPSAAAYGPKVEQSVKHDVSPELRSIPPLPPTAGPKIVEIRRPRIPGKNGPKVPSGRDPVLQDFSGPLSMPAPLGGFDGVSNVNGVLPPDPNGAVGPSHYVQWVNLSFAVYDKAGTKLYGPAAGNTLWQGFGGPCATQNDGDPIALYDKQADRWLMSQLALPNFPSGPFYQCLAVSQTSDPLGAFHRYAFPVSNTLLNDYPKFGAWPDGYYLAVNQFLCYDIIPPFGFIQCDWAGQGAFAFERDKMLIGQAARMVSFTLPTSNLGGMLPSDADGPTPPPAGAPNYFVQVDDGAWFTPAVPDRLQIWPFHVDWTTPSSSTFGPNPPGSDIGTVLATEPFDSNLCGYSPNCIPQAGQDLLGDPSPGVDALADRLMYRLQYRNFGTHQTLLLNHTVDVDGTDHAGIRWYELRKTDSSDWSISQQGTYAPDGKHRWMGSIAMDGAGNIALGFSVSSATTYPSIAYVGQQAGGPGGVMTEAEAVLVTGTGAQESSSGRWGDYSALTVDPTDDCTFWYTQEYYATTDVITGANWRTHVGAFRFASCGSGGDAPPSVSITSPTSGATVSGTITVTASASDNNGVTKVEFFVDGASIGVDTDGTNGWSTPWKTTTVPNGGRTLTAIATDTANQTTTSSPVPATVANGGASPNNMAVFSINWQSGKSLTVTITIRRDSNSSGGLTSGDAPVAGASVKFVLTRDSNGNGSFECGTGDSCWTFSGSTNSNGSFRGKLINAPPGFYQAKVTGVTHGTYTWTPSLDLDNPDTFTK